MEDPALSSSADDSDTSPQIQSNIEGDGNQAIFEMKGGTAINRVDGNVFIHNYYHLPIPVDSAESDEIDQLPCPYRGLSNFEPGDAKYFFGRESFVEELVQAMQTRNFIPLLGASGSGKSSVVFAGLVPKLQQTGHWQFTYFRPDADPFYALAEALVPLYRSELDSTDNITQAGKLSEDLKNGTTTLARVFSSIQRKHPNQRVLLIADQFEQLYTLCTDETTRHNFLDKLLTDIFSPTDKTPFAPVLVATMRADFFSTAISYSPFADVLQNANLILKPMDQSKLTNIIEKPAQMLGVTFEAGLVKRILDDVDKEPGILPLLEFALTELWTRRSGKQLTHAAYGEIGEVQGALDLRANQEYAKFSEVDRDRVRRIFIQLVRPGEGVEDTRRIATKGELGEDSWSLVEKLATARLVVTSHNAGQETVEVVHEALIRNWGELRGWMEIDRVFRAWQERLRGSVQQWQETDQDEGSLLHGLALEEAEKQLRQRPEELVAESDFIKMSIQNRDRIQDVEEMHRKLEIRIAQKITVGSLVAVVVISGLGWRAWQQTQESELRLADALGHYALSLVKEGKDLDAFISAIRAGKILQNQQTSNESGPNALQEALNYRSERNRLEDHQKSVMSVSFSHDHKILATGSKDKTIKLWDVKTGKIIRTLEGHTNEVRSVSFSHNDEILATGSADKMIKLWNIKTGELIDTLQRHQDTVHSVSFSPKSNILATGSADKTIKLWNIKTRGSSLINTLRGHQKTVYSVSFSPDGETLATGSADTMIKLWNVLQSGKFISNFIDPNAKKSTTKSASQSIPSTSSDRKNEVYSVSFSPDGKTLATGSSDQTIKLWDVQKGKVLHTLEGHEGKVMSVSFSSDSKILATGSFDKKIKLWDVHNGNLIQTLSGHKNQVYSVNFSPDRNSKTLATGSFDNTIKLWSLDERRENNTLEGHESEIYSVSFSPDRNSKTLATGSGDDTIKLWDVDNKKEIYTFSKDKKSFMSVSFNSDGKILAAGSADNTTTLWNTKTGVLIRTLKGHNNKVRSVRFSPDGETLATGSEDKTTKLWNVKTGVLIRTLEGHKEPVTSVSFRPNSETLATGSEDNTTKLWNVKTGELIRILEGHKKKVRSVSFSPDGETLATGSEDTTIKLWNVKTGKLIDTLNKNNSVVYSISFSSDRKTLATGNANHTIKLWDLNTRKNIRTIQGHQDAVYGVSFSPDGKTLATGSSDRTIKLWNRETGWDLDALMGRSCDWVRPYLLNNINVSESDRHLCDGVGSKKQY
jgi:WD40 repeat protein